MKNNRYRNITLPIFALLLVCGFLVSGCDDDPVPTTPVSADPLVVDLTRLSWSYPSVPVHGQSAAYVNQTGDDHDFLAQDRVERIGWYLPVDRVVASSLDPSLTGSAGNKTVNTLEMYLMATSGVWRSENWGGIMSGTVTSDMDVSSWAFLDVWVNDGVCESPLRSGTLHFDIGAISEDFYWPADPPAVLTTGTFEYEDIDQNGEMGVDEDSGLDGRMNQGTVFSAVSYDEDLPFPNINFTERNNRLDTEDLDENGVFDQTNSFLTGSIDLKNTEPLVDVVNDNDVDLVQDLFAANIAWRRYRIPLRSLIQVTDQKSSDTPMTFSHMRIWYENDTPSAPQRLKLQIAKLRFVDYE